MLKNIIAIHAPIGGGKDTVGSYMEEYLTKAGYTCVFKKFASPIKEMMGEILNLHVSKFEERGFKEAPIQFIVNGQDHFITPRFMMQTIGAYMRSVNPDIWANAIFNEIAKETKKDDKKVFIITDLRYPNEANFVLREGGWTVKIDTPNLEIDYTQESECALLGYNDFTKVIKNDKTLYHLRKEAETICKDWIESHK